MRQKTDAPRSPASAAAKVAARTNPRQDRSRARRQELLDTVEEIVTQVGLDGVEMRVVARSAGVPLASVYHYFPSKASIVRELAVRRFGVMQTIIAEHAKRFPAETGAEPFIQWLNGLLDAVYCYSVATPSVAAIIHAVRADPDLRQLDHEDSWQNSQHLIPVMRRLLPARPASEVRIIARTLQEMATSVILLAADTSDAEERSDFLAALKMLLGCIVQGLLVGEKATGHPPS